jgi:hypothetical protein
VSLDASEQFSGATTMKSLFKFFPVFLFFVLGSFLQASDVQVTKKSYLERKVGSGAILCSSAINTATGETLVVWQGNATNGTILDPQGRRTKKEFKIPNSNPNREGSPFGCGVAYNPITQEFLVVYHLDVERSIHGIRVDSQARIIGKEFTVVGQTSTNPDREPHVVFNPQTNGYTLVWDKWEGIAAANLDQSGKLSGSIVIVKKNPGKNGYFDERPTFRILDAKFLSSGSKLLVVFTQRIDQIKGDIWLAALDPMLAHVPTSNLVKLNKKHIDLGWNGFEGSDPVVYFGWIYQGASLAMLQDGSAMVFYADGYWNGVKRRKIDQQGRLSGVAHPAFSAPIAKAHLSQPLVAFSTTANGTVGLLIAKQDNPPKDRSNLPQAGDPNFAWAQALDSKGRPIGDPVAVFELLPDNVYDIGSALIAVPLNSSDKLFHFVWMTPTDHIPPKAGKDNILRLELQVQP